MSRFFTRETRKSLQVEEDYSHKLKNFQLVRPLSVEQQIERFTASGQDLLRAAGLGVYDFNEAQPLDDELDDPTREPDYDLIDAAVANRDAKLRIQAAFAAGTEAQSMGGIVEPRDNENKVNKSSDKAPPRDEPKSVIGES